MIILRERFYREKVPNNIAIKARKEGVVQQDSNGDWRIISFKQNPPEYWDAHYDSKEDAEKALSAYHAQKHFSSYDDVSDEDLDQEIYRRAMKKSRRKALIRGAIFGGLGGLATGLWKGRGPGLLSILGGVAGAVGSIGIGAARNAFRADLSNRDFVKALKEEYNKAYRVKPPKQLGPIQQSQKYGSGTNGVVEEYDEDN